MNWKLPGEVPDLFIVVYVVFKPWELVRLYIYDNIGFNKTYLKREYIQLSVKQYTAYVRDCCYREHLILLQIHF